MARIGLDCEQYDRLIQTTARLGENVENAINEALRTDRIKIWMINSITESTPVSSAKLGSWHPVHAKNAKPYKEQYENLAVTIKSRKDFHYLYFPDDGSNTKRHQGMQQFMLQGMENVSGQIVDEIVEQIVEKTGWN